MVHRTLWSCEDFHSRSLMVLKKSVGGCYMTPKRFTLKNQGIIASVSTFSMTMLELSLNYVLDSLMKEFGKGVQITDALGRKCVIVVDIALFVANYPALPFLLDLLVHSAYSPCKNCTF